MTEAQRRQAEALGSAPMIRGGGALLLNRLRARLFRRLVRAIASERSGLPRLPIIPGDMVSEISFVDGLYEIGDLALVAELVRSGGIPAGVALDIGANVGNHALAFAALFDEVIAFEPFPATCHLLRAALALNHVANVAVAEVALGSSNGKVRLVQPGGDLGGIAASTELRAEGGADPLADVIRGDDWLTKHRPDISDGATRVAFVKLDIEGFEAEAIAGLSGVLERQGPVLMIESQVDWAFERFAEPLKRLGYAHFHAMRGAPSGAWPARLFAPRGRKARLERLDSAPLEPVNVLVSRAPLS